MLAVERECYGVEVRFSSISGLPKPSRLVLLCLKIYSRLPYVLSSYNDVFDLGQDSLASRQGNI
jgi:hypothetical protein